MKSTRFEDAQSRYDHLSLEDMNPEGERRRWDEDQVEEEALEIARDKDRAQDAVELIYFSDLAPLLAQLSHQITSYKGYEREVGVLDIADRIHALLMEQAYRPAAQANLEARNRY